MLNRNEENEIAQHEYSGIDSGIAFHHDASSPSVQTTTSAPQDKAELIKRILAAGPFQEALQIQMRPPRPRLEVVAALKGYVYERSAAKEAMFEGNPPLGSVTGYFITRHFTEIDPRDGIEKGRMRTTLLINPNTKGTRRNDWLNSVYLPHLSCDIDDKFYFRYRGLVSLEVVKDSTAIANEIDAAFAEDSKIMALGTFERLGIHEVWVKPYHQKKKTAF